MQIKELKEKFVSLFGGEENDVRVFDAAGRVNLIGEHVDYCGGRVLPAALSLRSRVALVKNGLNILRLKATTTDLTAELQLDKLEDYRQLKWGNYQAGVAFEMQKEGYSLCGLDMLYDCEVPFGAGLSSSASIEVATAIALSTISKESGGKEGNLKDFAKIGQRAENDYCGVSCGIMDQFASALGKKGQAILLNCDTLEYRYAPLDLKDYKLVIGNSNKQRSLAESKYNERYEECGRALKIFQQVLPGLKCLADLSKADFEKHKGLLSGKVLLRAQHIVYECERVEKSVEALENGDLESFGKYLNQSHFSLRDLYEVTGFELDTLTALLRESKYCLGSRMTGAGFGGCTVSLIKKDRAEEVVRSVKEEYFALTGRKADFYDTLIDDGARELK